MADVFPYMHKMFCFPCLLFSDKSGFGYDKAFTEATEGCKNFKKGIERIKKSRELRNSLRYS